MNRRDFLRHSGLSAGALGASAGMPFLNRSWAGNEVSGQPSQERIDYSFSMNEQKVQIYLAGISDSVRITMIADTHLFRDDQRGDPYREYSERMAKAYNQTAHFKTGEQTDPESGFRQAVDLAQENNSDLFSIVGDLFSFPSEAAIEWVQSQLADADMDYLYVAGNHDWHYEGMPGTLQELRETWIHKRLLPLYQSASPLMFSRVCKGVRIVAIDNSDYQITPEQLAFFKSEVSTKAPLILMLHIPLYAPGRPVGFGCGHPDWGHDSDRNYLIERRPRWPVSGHTPATMAFHEAVFSAPNLLAVFAGHIHRQSLDILHGIPQIVAPANANAGFLQIEVLPA
jgi:hypothetical protein